jgi:4-diphosphocytidyl-2-C-methyl-D-erythritol kinase
MIAAFAPAKLNLSLHVVGKRIDGYHLLDSLVAFADIGDEILVAPNELLTLSIDGPFARELLETPDNLVLRAARALGESLGLADGAKIRLTKNLPVASGIGGGSADAAATLRGLSKLWRAPVPADLAAALGADVPVCVASRPAWMSGVGEIVEPVAPLPPWGVVLVNPGIALPTAKVFAARSGAFAPPLRAAPTLAFLAAAGNDLQAPAMSLVPAIADVLTGLARTGAPVVRMSGSGATCFALFADRGVADHAARALKSSAPSAWWIASGALA